MKKQLFSYEAKILATLSFNTSRVLIIDFLHYFIVDARIPQNSKMFHYCFYLLNISYLSPKLQSISKSLLAFSIVYFVIKIFGKIKEWPLEQTITSKTCTKTFLYLKISQTIKPIEIHQREFSNSIGERIGDCNIDHLNNIKNDTSVSSNLNRIKSHIQFDVNKVKSTSMEIFAGKILFYFFSFVKF